MIKAGDLVVYKDGSSEKPERVKWVGEYNKYYNDIRDWNFLIVVYERDTVDLNTWDMTEDVRKITPLEELL
jgi:hypothetical protein